MPTENSVLRDFKAKKKKKVFCYKVGEKRYDEARVLISNVCLLLQSIALKHILALLSSF